MKRILWNLVLMTLMVAGVTGQSWAFGSRHHGGGGDQDFSGSNNSGTNQQNTSNGNFLNNSTPAPQSSNGDSEIVPSVNGTNATFNQGNSSSWNNSGKNQKSAQNGKFPVAAVPEPMTLSLLGTGLAGLLLKKKNT